MSARCSLSGLAVRIDGDSLELQIALGSAMDKEVVRREETKAQRAVSLGERCARLFQVNGRTKREGREKIGFS